MDQRTGQQNNALHKYFELVAKSLNEAGYDLKAVLGKMKEGVEIAWTKEMVKEILWKEIQRIMYKKNSTTELNKKEEIDRIYDVMNRFLGERLHVESVPFPSEELINELKNNQ